MTEFLNYGDIYPNLSLLSEKHSEILNEYRKNLSNLEFRNFTKQQNDSISNYGKGYSMSQSNYLSANLTNINVGGWHVGGLISYYKEYERNTKYLPIMTQTLRDVENVIVCGINVLDSNTSLEWHNDSEYDSDQNSLRIIWGLDIPEHPKLSSFIQVQSKENNLIETKVFKNNEFYIFKPSREHRVQNDLHSARSVLCIDIKL
jgi:aspartyl/asparaginyl beta-hydroxylase (cupin superfamily)